MQTSPAETRPWVLVRLKLTRARLSAKEAARLAVDGLHQTREELLASSCRSNIFRADEVRTSTAGLTTRGLLELARARKAARAARARRYAALNAPVHPSAPCSPAAREQLTANHICYCTREIHSKHCPRRPRANEPNPRAEAGASRPNRRGRGNAAANRPLRQPGGTKL
jgi:hypothetical protein